MADLQHPDLDGWIRRYLERVVNARDVSAVHELVAPDYVGSGLGWAPDRETLREFYAGQAAQRPDWHIDVQETVEVGDWVAVRAHAGGTIAQDEDDQPLETPYQRAIEWLAAFRVVDGQLAETRFLSLRDRVL
jgi:predicted SnoaL-like aldol condensation-catalyzing enzyme